MSKIMTCTCGLTSDEVEFHQSGFCVPCVEEEPRLGLAADTPEVIDEPKQIDLAEARRFVQMEKEGKESVAALNTRAKYETGFGLNELRDAVRKADAEQPETEQAEPPAAPPEPPNITALMHPVEILQRSNLVRAYSGAIGMFIRGANLAEVSEYIAKQTGGHYELPKHLQALPEVQTYERACHVKRLREDWPELTEEDIKELLDSGFEVLEEDFDEPCDEPKVEGVRAKLYERALQRREEKERQRRETSRMLDDLCDKIERDREVREKEEAEAKKKEEAKGAAKRPNLDALFPAPIHTAAQGKTAKQRSAKREVKFTTLANLFDHPELLKPPERVSRLLGWKGQVTMFWAREKAGKSTIATWDAAYATRQGKKVLWLSFDETASTFTRRFSTVSHVDANLVVVPEVQLANWEEIEEAVEKIQPDLIVVDSLTSAIGALMGKPPETSASAEWMRWVLKFQKFAVDDKNRPLRAVVLLGHAKKNEDDYAGSYGLGAAVDMLVSMRRSESNDRTLKYKGRFEAERVSVTYNPDTCDFTVTTPTDEWFALKDGVVGAVGDGCSSRSKLRDRLRVKSARLADAVNALLEEGKLREPKRGVLEVVDIFEDVEEAVPDLSDLTQEQVDND